MSNPNARLLRRMSVRLQVSVGYLLGEAPQVDTVMTESKASWDSMAERFYEHKWSAGGRNPERLGKASKLRTIRECRIGPQPIGPDCADGGGLGRTIPEKGEDKRQWIAAKYVLRVLDSYSF